MLVIFYLVDLHQPTVMVWTTLTNAGFVPGTLFCVYRAVLVGNRVDLIVDGLFMIATANASLWYHFCSVSAPKMSYCLDTDDERDHDVHDVLMWWDFATSYMLFVQAALILADIRVMVLKLPMYGISFYMCYEGMRDQDMRTKALGSDMIRVALGTAIAIAVARLAYVFARSYQERNDFANVHEWFVRVVRWVNPLPLGLCALFFLGGMLCTFVWQDSDAAGDDLAYARPHGLWHIGMSFACGSMTWTAVDFADKWRERLFSTPSSPERWENCEVVVEMASPKNGTTLDSQ